MNVVAGESLHRPTRRSRLRILRPTRPRAAAVLVSVAMFGLLLVVAESRPGRAEDPVADGSSSRRAAPSCWAIKQALGPAAADGVYWLQTRKLVVPEQFYCDMTTDGGGWVLVGRGREGWSFGYAGQGSPADVRSVPAGVGAFRPAALSTRTVDALLDGLPVDSLDDGIRLRRALDGGGSEFREARLRTAYPQPWTWALGAGIPLSRVAFGGIWLWGTFDTRHIGVDDSYSALSIDHSRRRPVGFVYGPGVTGSKDPNSYLWSDTGKEALPFTQVFLRPKVATPASRLIPDSGLPAEALAPLLENETRAKRWGVVGLDPGTIAKDLDAAVHAFAQVGRAMFVGGKFKQVHKATDGTVVDQPYLAAFDVLTGEWRPEFRPRLDGPVWALAATSDGRLLVGGEFASIDGAAGTAGLGAVDVGTGRLDLSWRAKATASAGPVDVRALDIQGGWVYVAGNFNAIAGGSALSTPRPARRLARLGAKDGTPDTTWAPGVATPPWDIDASERGDRVYIVGHFDEVNGSAAAQKMAALDTTTGALVPGLKPWVRTDPNDDYQQTIREIGDIVIQGGAQHMLHQYDRSDYTFRRGHMTIIGGDFQAIAVVGDTVYASCHCNNWAYSDQLLFRGWPSGFTTATPITYVGAWDLRTFDPKPDFQPAIATAHGEGPWALTVDSNSCMWMGGDIDRGSFRAGTYQYAAGFAVTCPRDTTPPAPPATLRVSQAPHEARLTWAPVEDDRREPVAYEVLSDNRVVATTSTTAFVDRGISGPHRYWVRAVDRQGNRSSIKAPSPTWTYPTPPRPCV